MTIGTLEIATAACAHHDSTVRDSDEFTFLGSGAFRTAYLHIATQVVYKVTRWDGTVSDAEVRAIERLRKMIWQGVYIPKASRWIVPVETGDLLDPVAEHHVVAMEYFANAPLAFVAFEGDWESAHTYASLKEFRAKSSVWDMHLKNWLLAPGGIMIPIDLGDEG